MKERRQHKRFMFRLPVRIETVKFDRNKLLDLFTKDISSSGTYITTLTSFPENTQFNLDFTLPTDNLKGFKNIESLKKCTGKIVRFTHHGFAVQFDKECPIESLKAV